jgi:hypothetical protein
MYIKITSMLVNEVLMMSHNFQADGSCAVSGVINGNI